MSSSRGNTARKRPQKHQNKTAFKNDLHDTSGKIKFLNSLDISETGVCNHCKDVIEWKIKFKKYKPLTAPKKCAGCECKNIKYAYHIFCNKCSKEKNVCPKCCKANELESTNTQIPSKAVRSDEIEGLLKKLPERKRRTILRQIKKLSDEEIPQDLIDEIEELLSQVNVDSLNDFLSDDDGNESDE